MKNEHDRADPDRAAQQSKESAFEKELEQDAAMGSAESLAQADLVGPLTDGDQHDVDDANRAQGKCDEADAAEEPVHGGENLAHRFLVLDRVPFFPDVCTGGIKAAVMAGHYAIHLGFLS